MTVVCFIQLNIATVCESKQPLKHSEVFLAGSCSHMTELLCGSACPVTLLMKRVLKLNFSGQLPSCALPNKAGIAFHLGAFRYILVSVV